MPASKSSVSKQSTAKSSPAKEKVKKAATPKPSKASDEVVISETAKKPVSSKKKNLEPLVRKAPKEPIVLTGFLKSQRELLLDLKDTLLDSMHGVAKGTLRARAEGSEGNAFGMHQADAGSDACDRDFALSMLSLEQNALYEIDEALKRIEDGCYGVCEISEKPIPQARLEALPFTRYTVECQAELEKNNRFRAPAPVTSLFGLGDDDSDSDDDEISSNETKD